MKVFTFCSSSVSLSHFFCFWFIYKKESVNLRIFPKMPFKELPKFWTDVTVASLTVPINFYNSVFQRTELVCSFISEYLTFNKYRYESEFKLFQSSLSLVLSFITKNDKFKSKVMCDWKISNLLPYKTKGRHRKKRRWNSSFVTFPVTFFFFGGRGS